MGYSIYATVEYPKTLEVLDNRPDIAPTVYGFLDIFRDYDTLPGQEEGQRMVWIKPYRANDQQLAERHWFEEMAALADRGLLISMSADDDWPGERSLQDKLRSAGFANLLPFLKPEFES